ncbi:MAG: hypothetical protein IPK82_29170 [Polyangiaceae bacterium]|nr:hypothetical protein [Polyangiaceae bacterium]
MKNSDIAETERLLDRLTRTPACSVETARGQPVLRQVMHTVDMIVINNWPKLSQGADGWWERDWEIVLTTDQVTDDSVRVVEHELSDFEKSVKIEVDGKKVKVHVRTARWGWDHDLYTHSYNLLEAINDRMGQIDTIQGQARNLWNPWLLRLTRAEDGR